MSCTEIKSWLLTKIKNKKKSHSILQQATISRQKFLPIQLFQEPSNQSLVLHAEKYKAMIQIDHHFCSHCCD